MLKKIFKKEDLAKNLSIKTGLSTNFSKKIINDLVSIISNNIKLGKFNLKNVGSFNIIYKNQRIGRNPKTKEEFIISSRKAIKFIPSKKLIKYLHG